MPPEPQIPTLDETKEIAARRTEEVMAEQIKNGEKVFGGPEVEKAAREAYNRKYGIGEWGKLPAPTPFTAAPRDPAEEKKATERAIAAGQLDNGIIRQFMTGATRDTATDKLDYEGFLSPLVLERYAQYMHRNRVQSDGSLRDSDNWQNGIPRAVYMKSLWRHFVSAWTKHRILVTRDARRHATPEEVVDDLCGVLFNAMGYMHEVLVGREVK